MENSDEQKSPGAEKDPKRFVDKRTDERIQQHFTNEEDNILAQDINNVQSDIHSHAPVINVTDDEKVIINDEDLKEEDRKEDTDKPRDITPWNVID